MSAETHARCVGFVVALVLCAATARAQNPEARARGLMRGAMEEDYLATNMKGALTKLQSALKACDKEKCSKETVAKIYANLGIIYSAGLDKNDDAVEQFKKALALDPNVVPDPNYVTDVVQKAFDTAKGAGKAQETAAETAELTEQTSTEQVIGTPVPVYVEPPEGVEAARVVVRYKTPGQRRWKQLVLQSHGKGFGGYIPCAAVQKAGELSFFTTAFDANNERVASAGSASEPRSVELKSSIEGSAPALPDDKPPAPCSQPEAVLDCERNEDCGPNQVCEHLQCVAGSVAPPDEEPAGAPKQNWLGVAFSPDLVLVQTTADACSPAAQEDGRLGCFYRDGTQYSNAVTVNPGELKGGMSLGSMRAMLLFDRVIQKRMLLGVRLGFAFLGHPSRTDGKTFFPLHAEARFAFFFAKDPFAAKGIRPFAFVTAGAAETNARVGTVVTEPGVDTPTGPTGNVPRSLDAYQKGGSFFGGLGGGVQYALSPRVALVGELSLRGYAPLFVVGISPVVGLAYGL